MAVTLASRSSMRSRGATFTNVSHMRSASFVARQVSGHEDLAHGLPLGSLLATVSTPSRKKISGR
jgi:hypothetical protein